MKIEIPMPPKLREDGDYQSMVTKGYGDPRGTISLDDKWKLVLNDLRPADCDGLIKAAAEIREKVLAYRAELARPHGTKHLYKGRCQLCGNLEEDDLHADPELEATAALSAAADAGTPVAVDEDEPARVGVPERIPTPQSHYCDSGNCDVCGDVCGDGTGDEPERVPDPIGLCLHPVAPGAFSQGFHTCRDCFRYGRSAAELYAYDQAAAGVQLDVTA